MIAYKNVSVPDPLLLLWAIDGDTIDLDEGTFVYKMGNRLTKEVYLTKIDPSGEETFTHVRSRDGKALIHRGDLVDMLLQKEYTVS